MGQGMGSAQLALMIGPLGIVSREFWQIPGLSRPSLLPCSAFSVPNIDWAALFLPFTGGFPMQFFHCNDFYSVRGTLGQPRNRD